MTSVVLTGFMGTGKSTVGQIVGRRCGVPFVDLDCEIERRAGKTIQEIFTRDGERAFRRLEGICLAEILARDDDVVIATGGGALLSAENRALLNARHAVICLTASPEEVRRRLRGMGGRPLLQGDVVLETLMEARAPIYRLFPQVDSTARPPEDVAEDVIRATGASVAGRLSFDRTYRTDVIVEVGGTDRLSQILTRHGLEGDMVVVTDSTVSELGLVRRALETVDGDERRLTVATIPSGEEHKSIDSLSRLYDTCLAAHLDRSAIVLAIGGGVICDLAGMLAATYLRGLRYVALPTTAVAQVDASIGAKVGVDLREVKNIVGAFHPANLVVVDPQLLGTLPATRLADGAAEIIKIGLMRSAALLGRLERMEGCEALAARPDVLRGAALEKLEIVRRDPLERGERMLLNFGHTVGHGLETASHYRLSHGQAVSIGMMAETRLAVDMGLCDRDILERLIVLLRRFGLPRTVPRDVVPEAISPEEVLSSMQHDKKRAGLSFRLALPTGPGAGEVITIGEAEARQTIDYALMDFE